MNIVYLAICHAPLNSGIGRKIQDQIEFWETKGHRVSLLILTNTKSKESWESSKVAEKIWVDTSIISRPLNRFSTIRYARSKNPDIVYVRDAFPFFFPKSINPKMVLEVNSIQQNEIESHSKFKRIIFALTSKRYYLSWHALVYVTPEIKKELEAGIPGLTERPSNVISNGINLERILELDISNSKKPNFAFLGTPGLTWNGIDSIIELARRNQDCEFHIIGESKSSEIEYTSNIHFYGYLPPEEYMKILKQCHVALGTMEVERKGMFQGCSLKTREYLALGLPVVIRYEDVDFLNEDTDFILRIPIDSRSLAAYSAEILNFVETWSNKRVSRDLLASIDIRNKELKRIAFFQTVILPVKKEELREP
jgi:glycosyltransferase involved in cell wall biosynthesis